MSLDAETLSELDDSLIVDTRSGKQRTTSSTPFSVSALSEFAEDPMKYYIKRCLKKREPMSVALSFGSAIHDGFEEFYTAESDRVEAGVAALDQRLDSDWESVEDRTERYNPDVPHFAYGKENFNVTLPELKQRGRDMLVPFLGMLEAGWDDYTPTRLMRPTSQMNLKEAGAERRVGDVAKDRGQPTTQMDLFDPQLGKKVSGMNVALVAGLPIWGWIDLVMEWEDGTPAIFDHKGVTHVVSFYGPTKSFPPSYDPRTDLQLDTYSVATAITRSGFQFVTKQPQYVPRRRPLAKGWVDEQAWLASGPEARSQLPTAITQGPKGDHTYIAVWRPAPQDHPSEPKGYTPVQLRPRVFKRLRRLAEQITISNILLDKGVPPKISFPSGDPDEIAKKACPYCFFNDKGICPEPRRDSSRSKRRFRDAFSKRADLIDATPEIQERIQLWNERHKSFYAQ